MTASAFAVLLEARSVGAGKWQARCPAHSDKDPSLSIKEGRDGRVLLNCFAGCSLSSVLKAMGLRLRDLFAGELPSPEQRAKATWQRVIHEAEQARQRDIGRAQRDRVHKLECLVDYIGGRLARRPDDLELSRLFHLTCDRFHDAEPVVSPELCGKRLAEPTGVPADVAAALNAIGRDFVQ